MALLPAALGAPPARASFQTDPPGLARLADALFARGARDGWTYTDQRAYFSALLDAGRAFALRRPNDPQAPRLRAGVLDAAVRLRYDPLVNHDAAAWYVEGAADALQSDPVRGPAARALAEKLAAERADPVRLAADADADASANAAGYPNDAAALVDQVDADLSAYALVNDPHYRALALLRAAQPRFPIRALPPDVAARLWPLAEAARSGGAGYDDTDRMAATAMFSHRAADAPPRPVPNRDAASAAVTAPADEYFGRAKLSPLGIRGEMTRIERYLDGGWGDRMTPDALELLNALDDWRRQYPHDYELPRLLARMHHIFTRLDTDAARSAAERLRWILTVEYASSPEAARLT